MRRALEVIAAGFLLCCSCLFSAGALANEKAGDVASKSVYLPLYRGAEISATAQLEDVDWELPLAKFQKINGVWQFSKSEFLHGDLQKTTYLIKTHDLFNTIANFYQRWTDQSQIEVLFSCENRACGASNEWANGHFEISRLYGIDGKQRYWALKSGDEYLVLYLIERGNRQKLLHVERLSKN